MIKISRCVKDANKGTIAAGRTHVAGPTLESRSDLTRKKGGRSRPGWMSEEALPSDHVEVFVGEQQPGREGGDLDGGMGADAVVVVIQRACVLVVDDPVARIV